MIFFGINLLPEITTNSIITIFVLFIFYTIQSNNTNDKNKNSIPKSPSSMIETLNALSSDKSQEFILSISRRLGSVIFYLNLPGKKKYVIGDYKLGNEILKDKDTDKPRSVFKIFQGTGSKTLFTSSSDNYQKQVRKAAMHAFSKNEINRMKFVANKYVDELINKTLDGYSNNNIIFDPAIEFNKLTFKVICDAAFENDNVTEQDFINFTNNADNVHREYLKKRVVNPLRKYLAIFIPTARKAYISSENILSFINRLLNEYRDKVNKVTDNNTIIKIMNSHNSIIDHRQRLSELKDWLIAGHDTTGYTLANITTLLAKYPKIQNKLRTELYKTKLSGEKLEKCEYLKCVIKEGMRFMPVSAAGSLRVTGRDFLLDDGSVLPKGSNCFINFYIPSRNIHVYGNNVDEFIPERWINPNQKMKDAFIYIPFSYGSRSCPGQALAMAEINTTLPKLIMNYSIELINEGNPRNFLTFKYVGTQIKVKKIDNFKM